MTEMPELVALSHGFGGGAVALISLVEYLHALGGRRERGPLEALIPIRFEAVMGAITFCGSLVAFRKLQGTLKGRLAVPAPATPGSPPCRGVAVVVPPGRGGAAVLAARVVAVALGVLVVLPIGGADMPVVI